MFRNATLRQAGRQDNCALFEVYETEYGNDG